MHLNSFKSNSSKSAQIQNRDSPRSKIRPWSPVRIGVIVSAAPAARWSVDACGRREFMDSAAVVGVTTGAGVDVAACRCRFQPGRQHASRVTLAALYCPSPRCPWKLRLTLEIQMSPDCYTINTTEFCCRPTREQTVVEHRPGRLHQFSIAVWKEDPRAAFEGNLSVRVDFCKLLLHTISINSGRVL